MSRRTFHAVKKQAKRSKPEEALQRTVIQWLNLQIGNRCIFYHCPNGEARSKGTGGVLKAMGVMPGVADLCFVLPSGQAAFIELKVGENQQTDTQILFEEQCHRMGAHYEVCRSLEEVMGVVNAWLPKQARAA